jgi:polyisoprenoid-binding protein YceI
MIVAVSTIEEETSMSAIEETTVEIPTGTWKADTVHSSVGFEVPYAVATFSGDVPGFEATLENGTLTGIAKIETITVKEENLQGHLLSPEFFDAERHPEVKFVSRSIKRDGDDVEIEGDLTMKGITHPATLKGTATGPTVDHFGATRLGLKLATVVDRTQYDMNWNMPLPNGEPALGKEVTLKADLTLVAQDEA